MPDEAGRFTAEHTVMDKNLEIREQTHLLEVRDKRIDDLLKENQHLESDNKELRVQLDNCQRCKASDSGYPKSEGLTVHFDDGQSYDNRVKMSGDNPTGELDESEDEFTEQLSFTYNQE